ncbi:preprotein translocase subunit YajC [Cohaesibacter celericrescens]|jgi:preprotein translocase subunit YajC|uniref:Sec translocon accessory complex subunit YajC n=2 Tax=Cohaesibacter celericrescens TaxID=2067669 RepID=A0A2N5XTB4_9HYPH|nr:preprotein translocase subunit YajC [Cohaesibacter celericrescens]PLW77751.1 preprotein translocase subunit YajC [Cohaesibacter celericrescens]
MDTNSAVVQFLPFVLIFVIMYFLIIRPQRQQIKKHAELVANARRGDTIVTGGGIVGKITNATDENEVTVEISEGVKIKLMRKSIADVRSKGEPAGDAS